MYKELKLILLTLISIMLLVGCQQTTKQEKIEIKSNDKTTISYEELSEKEQYMMTVTGNNVVMYNIKNLPKDKNYKIELFYEEYKKGEKIREDIIGGIYSDEEGPKIDSQVLTLNYQEDKIRFVFGEDGGYYSGLYEIKEKFETGKDETDIKKNKSIITLNKLIEAYKRASKMKEMLGTMLIYLSDKIVIRRLNWDTRIGLDDAALTGISTGILWTFKNLIISFILNHKEIKDLNIDIVPEFNSLVLETDFYCIIKLKMVYIIIAGLNGIKVKIKGGGLNV